MIILICSIIIITTIFLCRFMSIRLDNKIRHANSLDRENYGKAYYEHWMWWSQRQIEMFNEPLSPIYDSILKRLNKNDKKL